MNRDKVKLIIRNMESLLQALKNEFEDTPEYVYEKIIPFVEDDVDEYYSEEDDV